MMNTKTPWRLSTMSMAVVIPFWASMPKDANSITQQMVAIATISKHARNLKRFWCKFGNVWVDFGLLICDGF